MSELPAIQTSDMPAPSRELAGALRKGRRYRTELTAEDFEQLLEAHPRVALLPGKPSQSNQERVGAEISAWCTGPGEFVLAPVPPHRHELEPPALHVRFEAGGVLHMQASLSLAAEFDAVLRTWIDRFGLFAAGSMFFMGTYAGSVMLIAALLTFLLPLFGVGQSHVFWLAGVFSLVPAWWSTKMLSVFRFERASERAWRLALPPLHRIAGELVTPHTLGTAGRASLPYRARLRKLRRGAGEGA